MLPVLLTYFLSIPQPDCSTVTKDMIAPTLIKWDIGGHDFIHIRYNFFNTSQIETYYPTITPTGEYRKAVESLIKQGLEEWSQATSRKIFKFEETQYPSEANLYFYLTSPDNFPAGVAAETFIASPSADIIESVQIYYPDDKSGWLNAYDDALRYIPLSSSFFDRTKLQNIILHEQGHALGLNLDGVNSSKAVKVVYDVLNNTPYGKFCSVMPYASNISSDISDCLACDPENTLSALGPLDFTMINQAYALDSSVPPNYYNMIIYNFASPVAHHFLNGVLRTLSYPSNSQHLLSDNKANLISDLALLMSSYILGATYIAYSLYLIPAIISQFKYYQKKSPDQRLPTCLQNSKDHPKPGFILEALRLAPLSFYIGVGLSINLIANSPGKTIANITTTITENTLGSIVGQSLGIFAVKPINSAIKAFHDCSSSAREQTNNKKTPSQDRKNERGPLLV